MVLWPYRLEITVVNQKNRTMLKLAGEALWGPQYRSEMSRQLDVHLRTVVRYDQGERAVPPVVLDRLYGLLIKRQADIGKLVAKLAAGRQVTP
jgi:hypothetical protein